MEGAKEVRRLHNMPTAKRIACSDAKAVTNVMVKKKRGDRPHGEVVDWKGWVWLKKKK